MGDDESISDSDVFRQFMMCLRSNWQQNLPGVRPVKNAIGPTMTEANTFDAGTLASSGLRVFLRFEHSSKSWKAGQFTADVVLLKGEAAPTTLGHQFSPKEGLPTDEGIYRIGGILSNRDKWWYLRDYDGKLSRSGDQWFAKNYDDTARVIADAVNNVTSDVVAVLKKLEAVPKPKP